MNTIVRWKHWDVVALVAGAIPLILFLIAAYTETKPFGDFSGHVMIVAGFDLPGGVRVCVETW